MDEIVFTAQEYQQDQSILSIPYRYHGSVERGWTVEREGVTWLELGPGYVPVKSLYCGICSTDLARYQLPFPLPQITGHELVGEFNGQVVAVEINASHKARGLSEPLCGYCQSDLDIHCPERMTLGIDRLPGGFSPWVLAPVNALQVLPDTVSPQAGVLLEPFAAAVKAIEVSPPETGDRIAVLGPRRLGMLIIAALDSYRKLSGKTFEIIAAMRHQQLESTAIALGADKIVLVQADSGQALQGQFDIVFDTTGSPLGFVLALQMAKRVVHVKSTHGQVVQGLEHLTSMVINEQCIAGFNESSLMQLQEQFLKQPETCAVYISPSLRDAKCIELLNGKFPLVTEIEDEIHNTPLQSFGIAIVDSLRDLNKLTRPLTAQGQSLLKARGTVLLATPVEQQEKSILFEKVVQERIKIETSRCGSFSRALNMWHSLPGLAEKLKNHLVTHSMDVAHLAEAMRLAAQSDKSIKVMVKTG